MSTEGSSSDGKKSSSSSSGDGLDKVELSDLDSSPPRLAIEDDLMQLARLGELRSIQKLFDTGRYSARSTDDQGITALHVRAALPEEVDSTDDSSGPRSTDTTPYATFSYNQARMSMQKEVMLKPRQCYGLAREVV